MILILLIVAAILVPIGAASLLLRYRSQWSNGHIALIAGLPFPVTVASLVAYIAGYARLVKSVDDVPGDLIYSIVVGAAMPYLIGTAVAAVTMKVRRKPPVDVADIFS